jgi:undecaprenyl-diphosphatase
MNQFELGILDSFTGVLANPLFDAIMPAISWVANSGRIWILVAVGMLLFKAYRTGGLTLGLALITELVVVNGILKPLIDRTRPFVMNPAYQLLAPPPSDGSFPSGHTAVSFAAAYVLFSVDKRLGIAAYVLAGLISFSRLYLYFHYPSDIVGGIVIGTLIGMFAVWVAQKSVHEETSNA